MFADTEPFTEGLGRNVQSVKPVSYPSPERYPPQVYEANNPRVLVKRVFVPTHIQHERADKHKLLFHGDTHAFDLSCVNSVHEECMYVSTYVYLHLYIYAFHTHTHTHTHTSRAITPRKRRARITMLCVCV